MAKKGLTLKQRRFAAEYLKDQNGTQAAIRAGYSKRTARFQAADLLTIPNIAEAVEAGLRKVEAKAILTREEIERAAKVRLHLDMGALVDAEGKSLALKDLPEEVRRAVSFTRDPEKGLIYSLNRDKAIDTAARIKGMMSDKLDVTHHMKLEDLIGGSWEEPT
ncbi:MAG: terminase small subunit [Elusimicrobia bacterium]|nr:terminase small subunit [Elusimicrobiota bacterium]